MNGLNFRKKTAIERLGLLGVVSLLSYTAAVVFAPFAFPGYNRLAQAVSDLSAETAPSRRLWNQLSCLYAPCGIVCVTLCALAAKGLKSKALKTGIILFAVMNWVSTVGYAAFPLAESGKTEGLQGVMHLITTGIVVALSIGSLIAIIIGGFKGKAMPSLAICALACLFAMFFGAIATNAFPKEYFGVAERFSVFSATIFTAVLGVHLYFGEFSFAK